MLSSNLAATDSTLGPWTRLPANVHLGTHAGSSTVPARAHFCLKSYHEPEILTLNQPSLDMLPSSIRCRGRVRY